MVKAKAIRRPARILEREIYRRSSHMSEDFHEGQSVCHVVGGQLMTGTIVEKDNVGAFIERPGVEKPVYILYFYLRPSDGITPTAQL